MILKKVEGHNGRSISLRVKLLFGFTMIFSLVFAGAYYWFYSYATNKAMQRIQEDLIDTLKGAIAGIDGDDFSRLAAETVPPGQPVPATDPLYQDHQEWLNHVYQIEPRSIPYTFIKGNEPYEILWIGDIFRIIRPQSQTKFRESYIADPSETKLYDGLTGLTVNMNPYTDNWGRWVSAYGPIRNSQGRVVGGFGIDFRADYVYDVQKGIRDSMVIAFAITYGSLFILVYITSGILTKPIVGLTKAAQQIGEGHYDQDLGYFQTRRLRDEISTLAEVFEMMVGKVRKREETLKQQVAELKIEIDQTKRQRQVKEIVETDFFQDLQAKAKGIRKRGREPLQEDLGLPAERTLPVEPIIPAELSD